MSINMLLKETPPQKLTESFTIIKKRTSMSNVSKLFISLQH